MNDSYDALAIRGDAKLFPEMNMILQNGFYLIAPIGKSLRDILLYWGLSHEYIESQIKTIFRNSHPVDDIDKTHLSEGDVIGLSGPMPGLVGAIFRSGSYLSPFRSTISSLPDDIAEVDTEGFIQLKVFNVVLKETGKFFLERGIYMKSSLLKEFFEQKNSSFYDHCKAILLNNKSVDLRSGNLRELNFSSDLVFLTVNKA